MIYNETLQIAVTRNHLRNLVLKIHQKLERIYLQIQCHFYGIYVYKKILLYGFVISVGLLYGCGKYSAPPIKEFPAEINPLQKCLNEQPLSTMNICKKKIAMQNAKKNQQSAKSASKPVKPQTQK